MAVVPEFVAKKQMEKESGKKKGQAKCGAFLTPDPLLVEGPVGAGLQGCSREEQGKKREKVRIESSKKAGQREELLREQTED